MEIINSGDDAIYYFRVSSTNRNINNNKKERSQAIDWKQRGRRRRRRINFCQKLCKSRHLLICASTSSFAAFRRLYLLVVGRGNLGVLPLNHIDKWCRGWRDEQRKPPRPSRRTCRGRRTSKRRRRNQSQWNEIRLVWRRFQFQFISVGNYLIPIWGN